MSHNPNDLLRVDFSTRERSELVDLLRPEADKLRAMIPESKDRLRDYLEKAVAKAERLAAQLEEGGTDVMVADDIRYLVGLAHNNTVALVATLRVWKREAV